MARVAVLASGGLDSAVLLADLARGHTVFPVYVEAGLAWEARERRALEAYLGALEMPSVKPLTVLEMPVRSFYGEHWSTTGEDVPGYDAPDSAVYLPGRNVLLIGVTAVWCALNDVEAVAIGSLDDNPFPDATPAFFADYGRVLSEALEHPLEVLAPYRNRHKSQIIAAFPDLPLELTLTCMRPVLEMGDTPKPPLKGRMGGRSGDADDADDVDGDGVPILETGDTPKPQVLNIGDTPKPPLKGRMGGQAGDADGVLVHCGDCNKCRERRDAFRDAGVQDRTLYAK